MEIAQATGIPPYLSQILHQLTKRKNLTSSEYEKAVSLSLSPQENSLSTTFASPWTNPSFKKNASSVPGNVRIHVTAPAISSGSLHEKKPSSFLKKLPSKTWQKRFPRKEEPYDRENPNPQ